MAANVEVTLKITTGASAQEIARVTGATTALARALRGVPQEGQRASASIRDIAAGTFIGQAAMKALEGATGLAMRGLGALVGVARQAVEESAAQERATSALNAALRASGQFSAAYSQSLQDLAGSLQRVSTFGDDAILSAERTLVQFGASRAEVERLTPAILDLAAATNTDLGSAAFKVSRALEGQVTVLKRSGIAIDENTRRTERAAAISDAIAAKYGGQATAAARTFTGSLEQLSNAWGDLLEQLGHAVTQNPALLTVLTGTTAALFDMQGGATSVADVIDRYLTAAILEMLDLLPGLVDFGTRFLAILLAVGEGVVALTRVIGENLLAITEWAGTLQVVGTALTALGALTVNPALVGLGGVLAGVGIASEAGRAGLDRLLQSARDGQDRFRDLREGVHATTEAMAANVRQNQELNTSLRQALDSVARRKDELTRGGATLAPGALEQTQEFQQAAVLFEEMARRQERVTAGNQALAASLGVVSTAHDQAGAGAGRYGSGLDEAGKKMAKLLEQVDKDILLTRAEVQARQEAAAAGLSEAETIGRVEAAKLRAQGVDEKRIAIIQAQKVALAEATGELGKFKAAQERLADLGRENAVLDAKIAKYQELTASGAKLEEIERALAGLDAAALGRSDDQRAALKEQAEANYDKARALQEVETATRAVAELEKDNTHLEAQIRILEQQRDGYLDAAAAARELALAEAARQKGSALTDAQAAVVARNADLRREMTRLEDQVRDSTINIGEQISSVFTKVAEGIALGTTKGLDALALLRQGGQAIFADMFSKMLASKLAFDAEINANFLQDIPNVVSQGAGLVSDTFGGLFDSLTGKTNNLTSSVGDLLKVAQGALPGVTGGIVTASQIATSGVAGVGVLSPAILAGQSSIALGGSTAAGIGGGVVAPGLLVDTATGTIVGSVGGGAAAPGGAAAGIAGAGGLALIPALGFGSFSLFQNAFGNGRFEGNAFQTLNVAGGTILGGAAIGAGVGAVGGALGGIGAGAGLGGILGAAGAGATAGAVAGGIYGIIAAILAVIGIVIAKAVGAFEGPTGGTRVRQGFENFLERNQNEVPFFAGRNDIDRNMGQGDARQFERQGLFTDRQPGDPNAVTFNRTPGINDDQLFQRANSPFAQGLEKYVDIQVKSIGLTERQLNQAKALTAAFRAVAGVGNGIGFNEPTRALALLAALLGNINEKGLSARDAMQSIGKAIENLGTPQEVFKIFNDFFTSEFNDISIGLYRDAIQGLADATFTDLPRGVRASEIALQELDKAVTATGEQGIVTFDQLRDRIENVSAAANLINPALDNVFQNALSGMSDAEIDAAFLADVQKSMAEAVSSGLVNGIIQAQLDATMLEPFIAAVRTAFEGIEAGTLSNDEAIRVIREATLDAKESIKAALPLVRTIAEAARAIRDAFEVGGDELSNILDSPVADIVAASDSLEEAAIVLATGLVRLEQAANAFNDSLEQRIFQLRNRGSLNPEIVTRRVEAIRTEITELRRATFPSITDVANLLREGRPDEARTASRRAAGLEEPLSLSQQLATLETLRNLTEQELAVRIAGVEAQRDLEVRQHQDAINALQKQRDAQQRMFADAIQARQDELSLIQEQVQAAQVWKGILDTINATILNLQIGATSPDAPLQRFGTAEREFDRLAAIFESTTATDEERQDAARKLSELAPQLLQLAQQGGLAQSSEAFQAVFDRTIGVLGRAQKVAAEGAKDLTTLQAEAVELQKEIARLQKESAAALRAIDDQIQVQQDAITAAQDRATAEIDRLSGIAADELEWIRGKGNAIFEARQQELADKLGALGVSSVGLIDIQAASLFELQEIRRVLAEGGVGVEHVTAAQFGISRTQQKEIKANVESAGYAQSQFVQTMRDALAAGVETAMGSKQFQSLFDLLKGVAPNAKAADDFEKIIRALVAKADNPKQFSSVLGFATGGLVSRETLARVGEGNRPELIVPLDRAMQDARVVRTLAQIGEAQSGGVSRRLARDLDRQLRQRLAEQERTRAAEGRRGAGRDVAAVLSRLGRDQARRPAAPDRTATEALRRADAAVRGARVAAAADRDVVRALERLRAAPGRAQDARTASIAGEALARTLRTRLAPDPALPRALGRLGQQAPPPPVRASRPLPEPGRSRGRDEDERAAARARLDAEAQPAEAGPLTVNISVVVDAPNLTDGRGLEENLEPRLAAMMRRVLTRNGALRGDIAQIARTGNAGAPRSS